MLIGIIANGKWNDDNGTELSKWIIAIRNRSNITICNFTICIEPNDMVISKYWDLQQTQQGSNRFSSPSWLQLASMTIYQSGIIISGNLTTISPLSIVEHYEECGDEMPVE